MLEQLTKALRRRKPARRRAGDSLCTPEGAAIPIWQADASDPVDHLAGVFDQLSVRRQPSAGKHRDS